MLALVIASFLRAADYDKLGRLGRHLSSITDIFFFFAQRAEQRVTLAHCRCLTA